MNRRVPVPVGIAASLLLVGSASVPQNLAYNGDFEAISDASPPPGWVMWGAQVHKVPENFTRDAHTLIGGAAPHGPGTGSWARRRWARSR